MNVLNIPVPPPLADTWRKWLAPERQPFFLTVSGAADLGLDTVPRASVAFTPEERDTFTVWNIAAAADRVAWLTVDGVDALPPGARRELLRAQVRHGRGNVPLGRHFADLLPEPRPSRFLWRRGQLTGAVLERVLSNHGQACRRADVPDDVWDSASPLLPQVRSLSGTFATGSAGNCFGTVMGAAGVTGAAEQWMQREPFEQFLSTATRNAGTRPGGHDDQPGSVLVWRSPDGLAQHAAVTLGGGWALHKPSQSWQTPRVVLPVGELKAATRTPGWHLSRFKLSG